MSKLLKPGDVVSLLAEARSTSGADRVQLIAEQQGKRLLVASVTADTLHLGSHDLAEGARVQLAVPQDSAGQPLGTLPIDLEEFTDYFVINPSGTTIQLSASEGGPVHDITDAGTGQFYVVPVLARHFGTVAQSATFADGRSMIEGVEIVEGYDRFEFFGANLDDTEDGEIRRVMAVRGPSAVEYTEPAFLFNVHTAEMIHLSTGETVEASIVAAQESLSQVATDLAEEITQRETDVDALTQSLTDVADDVAAHDQALTVINSRLGDAEDEIGAQASALQAIDTRVTEAEGEIGAQAQAITAIQTTVGENSAAISQHAESIDGLSVQWTVKLDVNGHIAGIGLASEPVDGVPSSAFTVLADSFLFAIPAVPWEASKAHAVGNYVKPSEATGFIYRAMTSGTTGANEPAWPTTVGQQVTDGGVTWECRALQAAQLMTTGEVNGQETVVFNTVHIGDATITDAKIGNISANKITGGLIQGEVIAVGDNNVILDGENSQIVVLDGQQIPATRVRLGKRPDGDYGLEVFDSNGNKVFGVAGATYTDGTNINDLKPDESGAQSTEGHGTDELFDSAGLGNSAVFSNLQDTPTTVDGYGISDAQKDLGFAMDNGQVLHRDTDGDAYWADKYGPEINQGAWRPFDSTTPAPATGQYVAVGRRVMIPNPGKPVSILCTMSVNASAVGGSDRLWWKVVVSWDGGATWDEQPYAGNVFVGGNRVQATNAWLYQGVPTNDVLLELRVLQGTSSGATINLTGHSAGTFQLGPRQEFALLSGPLIAQIDATKSATCTKNFPGTTCTASVQVTCDASGDETPYAYEWENIGPGAIVAGTFSKTCTVSDTYTTASPANRRQVTARCRVEGANYVSDALTPESFAISNDCNITLSFLRTYAPVVSSVPNGSAGCARNYPGICTASGPMKCNPDGGDRDFEFSWSHVSGDGAIVGGTFSETLQVSNTGGVLNGEANYYHGTFRCTVTDGRGDSDSDDGIMTFSHFGYRQPVGP